MTANKKETLIYNSPAIDAIPVSDDGTVRYPSSNKVGAAKDWLPASDKSNVSSISNISQKNYISKKIS